MWPLLVAGLLLGSLGHNIPVKTDTCNKWKSCDACTAAKDCGWCNGTVWEHGKVGPSCVSVDTTGWDCDGAFFNNGQCDCQELPLPEALLGTWRGISVDGGFKDEVDFEFALNSSSALEGIVTVKPLGEAEKVGSVGVLKQCSTGCHDNVLQINFKDGTHASCAYNIGWQDGGGVRTLALGCTLTALAPTCYDTAPHLLVLWHCNPGMNCHFTPPMTTPALTKVEPEPLADPCRAYTTCGTCPLNECVWCLGHLWVDGKELPGMGHCFGHTASYECQGFSLKDCKVWKCPWYEYYVDTPANCTKMEHTCNTPTTADDPDFNRRNTPATAYLDHDSCVENCVDPTLGCRSGECTRTYTCDPTSNCTSCSPTKQPLAMQGVKVSHGAAGGQYTFHFRAIGDAYVGMSVEDHDGQCWTAVIRDFNGTGPASFIIGDVERGGRIDVAVTGALVKNVYIAIGNTTAIPTYPVAMEGGEVFALGACQYNKMHQAVSGQNTPIHCALADKPPCAPPP